MPEAVTSVLEALSGYPWHREAACVGENMFPDEALARRRPGSANLVLPLLICARCPVREPCLREALSSWLFVHDQVPPAGHPRHKESVTSEAGAEGIWGGTTELDRDAVRSLPIDEAVAELENAFPVRLKAHLAAFHEEEAAGRVTSRAVRAARRIRAMLDEVDAVTVFP